MPYHTAMGVVDSGDVVVDSGDVVVDSGDVVVVASSSLGCTLRGNAQKLLTAKEKPTEKRKEEKCTDLKACLGGTSQGFITIYVLKTEFPFFNF